VIEHRHVANSGRELWLRRSITDPFSPLVILALGLAVAVLADTVWPLWVLFAAIAGYSLSGST